MYQWIFCILCNLIHWNPGTYPSYYPSDVIGRKSIKPGARRPEFHPHIATDFHVTLNKKFNPICSLSINQTYLHDILRLHSISKSHFSFYFSLKSIYSVFSSMIVILHNGIKGNKIVENFCFSCHQLMLYVCSKI